MNTGEKHTIGSSTEKSSMAVSSKSAWNTAQIEDFLHAQKTPMRIAVLDHDEFPMICSVWHQYHDEKIYAVAHKNSKLIKKLKAHPQCAFEIAPNEPPYKGVRGQAISVVSTFDSEDTLNQLLKKFLGEGYKDLQNFLQARSDDERVIELRLEKVTAWDFSKRMSH
jgi:uncharacterized pyridoxamine 5'-phosphate oxidase family protein